MKAMFYNLQKGMISAALVLTISSVGFAATKANEIPTPITNINSKAIALNSEAVAPSTGYFAEPSAETNTMELSRQIEGWMSDGSYWGVDNSSDLAEKVLSENIESWIESASYWTVPRYGHNPEARLAHRIKHWMNSESYWGTDEN